MKYHTEQVMTTKDAAKAWGTSQAYVKNLCLYHRATKIPSARQIGNQWIMDADTPNPKKK